MNLKRILERIGLKDKEAAIYLALLEYQESVPSVLAKQTEIKRSTTYVVLSELQKRGLVSQFIKKGITYFRAIDPKILLEVEQDRVKQLKEAMPELLALNDKFKVRPHIQLFEGREGIISIYEDSLNSETEILGWADAELVPGQYLDEYYPLYEEKKKKRNIFSRVILSYSEVALKVKKEANDFHRNVHLIPKEKFPFKNEIDIYEDKMAIISHQDQVGVIIQNENIAEMQRSIFDFAFEYAKLIENKLIKSKGKEY